jgi:hypothetical protein
MAGEFRVEHVQPKPQGWRARTILTHTGHEIRLGFPPGRRRKGAGRLLQILHPKTENPSCEVTPQRAAEIAGKEIGIENPSELLILGANPSELLILGAGNPQNRAEAPGEGRSARTGTQTDKAADKYREFHGKEPGEMVEIQRSDKMRKDYTGLGDLDALVIADGFDLEEYETFRSDMQRENGNFARVRKPMNTGLIYFERRDAVKIASNPDGTQLYLLGGNQDLSSCLLELGLDPTKDFIDLGFCICIRYITEKAQNRFSTAMYWHILGEETKKPPRMFYDKLKREIYFTGGEYVVKAPGIIN